MGIIKFIKSLFSPKEDKWIPARPLPPWPEIVETMYDQSLPNNADVEIIKIIYSTDREKRIIVFKESKRGVYEYDMERLCPWDEEEWLYVSRDPDTLPAMWVPFGSPFISIFGTEQEAWNDLVNSREYKMYFEQC